MDNNWETMVSIPLLTYNQKEYLGQCLDGILKQKVDFKIEILVGDDCSTDGTQEVMREYEERYPGVFTMIYREKNLGVTGNLYDLLKRCKGKYIAGLEGDDYWIDENKLAFQYQFMEEHPEYVACSHEVEMIDENGKVVYNSGKYIEGRHWTFNKEIYTWDDFVKFNLPGQGSTYFYRNIFVNPKYDYSIIETASPMIGDMTLLMLYTAMGDWYFMKGKTMTCYRHIELKGGGSWSSWAQSGNRCYHNFMFRKNLEDYARKVLHKPLSLRKDKLNYLYEARIRWMENPVYENERIYCSIWEQTHPKIEYWCLLKLKTWLDANRLFTVAYAYRTGQLDPGDERLKNSTWNKFRKESKKRTIVAFGEGVSFYEFQKKYGKKYDIPCILDNSEKKWNRSIFVPANSRECKNNLYLYSECMDPNVIYDWDKDKFVIIITTTLYQEEVAKQLREMGFERYYSFGNMEVRKWYYKLLKNINL